MIGRQVIHRQVVLVLVAASATFWDYVSTIIMVVAFFTI